MISPNEIEKRKPLWLALSDLWLDTEPNESTYRMIAREMSASGYSLEDIESIYAHEVAPAVYTNILNTAGVWDAFDADWLCGSIIENLIKQENNLLYRTWIKSAPGKFLMTKTVSDDWLKIVELYKTPNSI